MKMGFGKHKDVQVKHIRLSYLEWLSRQANFQKIKAAVRREICGRLGIEFIPNENPYAGRYGGVAKGTAIMNKALKNDLLFDDFNDTKKNV